MTSESYYLETNAIRTINKDLNKVAKSCFTSALVVFEIITGISEHDFTVRKSALVNLLNSNVRIQWELPETILSHAFHTYNGLEYIDNRIDGLKLLAEVLIQCDDLENFKRKTENEKYNLNYFVSLDKGYSQKFIEATSNGNTKLKEIYNLEKNNRGLEAEKQAKAFSKSLKNFSVINEALTLFAIVENIADGCDLCLDEKVDRKALFESYDNSTDIYIEAFSYYTATKSENLNDASKNDCIDLHHLLYLRNDRNCFIVSNDKLLMQITKQVINLDTFKRGEAGPIS